MTNVVNCMRKIFFLERPGIQPCMFENVTKRESQTPHG